MSVAKVMGILSFTTVVQLYNSTTKSRSYDGTTERSFGFKSGFHASTATALELNFFWSRTNVKNY